MREGAQYHGRIHERFICYWWFTGWTHLSVGVHVDLAGPNLELHVPFGFVRIGKESPIGECRVFEEEEP